MHEYELAGNNYDMGRQNATLLQATGYAPRPTTSEQLGFARQCEAVVEEHAAWLIEEIRGVADAGMFDPAIVKVLPLTLYADPGCSVIAVSGRRSHDGRPLFGRNYDFYASFRRYSSLYRTRPTDHLAHIGCSDHWVGRHDGMNEAGLAIGHSGPPPGERQPGFVITLAIRAVLDTCRTVAEAQSFLQRIPHLGNTTYLVADTAGDIVAVEASPRKVVVTPFPDEFGFLANRYVSAEMSAGSSGGEVPGSAFRTRNIERWSAAHPQIRLEDVQQVLADPNDGVCSVGRGPDAVEDPDVTL